MERRAKGSGLFGEPNCHIAFAWVRSLRSDQQRFRRCGRSRERHTALGLGARQRSKVRQQNVNDESHFNARPRASRHAIKFGKAQHAAHPQWARRSGLQRCGGALRRLLPQIQRDAIHGSCLLGGEDRPAQRPRDVRQGTLPLGEHLKTTQVALGPSALRRTQRHTQPGRFFLRRIQTAVQRTRNDSRRHLLLRQSRETAYFLLSPGALFRTF